MLNKFGLIISLVYLRTYIAGVGVFKPSTLAISVSFRQKKYKIEEIKNNIRNGKNA